MKKLNCIILGAAAFALASCSQDDALTPGTANGDGNFNITVKLPSDLGTRALGDGLSAKNLYYAVYDVTNGQNPKFSFQGEATFGKSLQTNLSLNLITGKSYKLAFFACSPTANQQGVYTFSPEAPIPTISVDYDAMTGSADVADAYDCFFNLTDAYTVGTSTNPYEVTLTRPVAQVNWGTNELGQNNEIDVTFGKTGQYIQTNLKVTGEVYTQFNILDKEVEASSLESTTLFSGNPAPVPTGTAFPVSPDTYKYVACQYLLAPSATSASYELTLNINNGANSGPDDQNIAIPVLNAPLQANYRTNIYGTLLSTNVTFNVTKDQFFAGQYNIEDMETFNITAADLANLTIKEDGIYKLSGELDGIYDTMTVLPGLNVIIDGSGLTSKDNAQFNLIFRNHTSLPNSPSEVLKAPAREGSYTFQNFTEGTINFVTGNTTVNFKDNSLDCIILAAGNVNVNIENNNIDGRNVEYKRWDNDNCECGMYLYMIDYDLNFNNNFITNAAGNPLQINGWALNGWPDPALPFAAEDLRNLDKINSFSENTIIVTEKKDTQSSWTGAIVFYGDGTYYWTNDLEGDEATFTPAFDTFKALVNSSSNNFYIGGQATGANQFKLSHINDGNSVRFDPFTTPAPADLTPDASN